MGKFTGLKAIISLSGFVLTLQSCNDIDEPEIGGVGFASATSGIAQGTTTSFGSGGSSVSPEEVGLAIHPLTGLELPSDGAAGSSGANAAGGAAGAHGFAGAGAAPPENDEDQMPLDPTNLDLDGDVLAGIWDDNQNFDYFKSSQNHPNSSGALKLPPDEYQAAHETAVAGRGPYQSIDIALVLDTTGSMQDELLYLNNHVIELWDELVARHPQATFAWSLVVYRDEGDDYLAKSIDFTSDQASFGGQLAQQQAAGGGDTPEAVEAALAEMNQLSWRSSETTARVAFWFTDAPHHTERQDRLLQVVREVRLNNIVVYPIASSNVHTTTTFSLRNVAQYTGGRYIFITAPASASQGLQQLLPLCFYATRLSDTLSRVISIELTGEYQAPQASTLIATHSNMVGGVCNTELGNGIAF